MSTRLGSNAPTLPDAGPAPSLPSRADGQAAALPQPGELIADDLEIVAVLGEGGMGRVYLARDLRLGRSVAVKMVAAAGDGAAWRAAFEQEARITAQLAHPNVVMVLRAGDWRGAPFLVMELLRGESLARRARSGAWPLAEVVDLATQVCSALEAAHAQGLVHRDLKAENIWVLPDGRVKVLDFGVATAQGAGPTPRGGTPEAMAPETWAGAPEDGRVDVFALGVLCARLLTGAPPFPERDPAALRARLLQGPGAPSLEGRSGLPLALARLMDACLSLNPAARPTSAQVGLELRRVGAALRGEAAADDRPFRYLEAFNEGDSAWFFGRDREVDRLSRMLERNALVAVIGPSGAGKTSLLRAGLVPRLRRDGPWTATVLRPGRSPLQALARALQESGVSAAELRQAPGVAGRVLRRVAAESGRKRLVVVDGAEELFTLAADPGEIEAFGRVLSAIADEVDGPLRVVLSSREDFLSRLISLLEPLLPAPPALFVLPAPTPEGLVAALVEPASRAGFQLEDDLAQAMVAEVAGDPTPLPLLQFAMSHLWERRDRAARCVRRAELDRLGGLAGILASHADEVVGRLPGAGDVALAASLLVGLLTPQRTRRQREVPALLAETGAPDRAGPVLEALVAGRLVVLRREDGRAFAELAHEALITRWERLGTWMVERRAERVVRERLDLAAAHWAEDDRPAGLLWRGEALDDAERLLHHETLSAVGRAFLGAAVAERSRAERGRRRLLAAVAGIAVIIALVASGGTLAYRARSREAEASAAAAAVALQEAEARSLAWRSRQAVEEDTTRALALAVEAGRRALVQESVEAMRDALARPWMDRITHTGAALVSQVELSPDASWLAIAANDGSIRIQGEGSEGGEEAQRFGVGEGGSVGWLTWVGPRQLVYATEAGRVGLLTLGDPAPRTLADHGELVLAVAPLPGGRGVASVSGRGLRVVDLEGLVLVEDPTPATWVDVSVDGRVAVVEEGGRLRLYPPGGPPRTLDGPGSGLRRAAFSRDGRSLYRYAGSDGRVERWSLEGERLATLIGHSRPVGDLYQGPGDMVVTVSFDRDARVWVDDREVGLLGAHPGRITDLGISADGQLVLTATDAEMARLSTIDGRQVAVLTGHQGWITSAALSPDGRVAWTGGQDGTVRRWDLRALDLPYLADARAEVALGRVDPSRPGAYPLAEDRELRAGAISNGMGMSAAPVPRQLVSEARPSRDRRRALTWSADRFARLWDLDTATLRAHLDGGGGPILDAAFDPAQGRVAVLGAAGHLRVWDRDGVLQQDLSLEQPGSLTWSPDGEALAAGLADGRVLRVGVDPPAVLARVDFSVHALAWAADGRLLVGGEEGEVALVGPDGEERARWGPARGPALDAGFLPSGLGWVAAYGRTRLIAPDGALLDEARSGEAGEATATVVPAPDGHGLLVGTKEGPVQVRDEAGALRATLQGHRGVLIAADFFPDGERVITASADGTARVFGLDGALLATLVPDGSAVTAVAVSADGARVATGSPSGQVRLWTASGALLGVVSRHQAQVMGVAFGPRPGQLLSWSYDAAMGVGQTLPEAVLAQAEARLAAVPAVAPP